MKGVWVIQYEPEVPYFKYCFSFQIYHTLLYLRLVVRQMRSVISCLTFLLLKTNITNAAFFFMKIFNVY